MLHNLNSNCPCHTCSIPHNHKNWWNIQKYTGMIIQIQKKRRVQGGKKEWTKSRAGNRVSERKKQANIRVRNTITTATATECSNASIWVCSMASISLCPAIKWHLGIDCFWQSAPRRHSYVLSLGPALSAKQSVWATCQQVLNERVWIGSTEYLSLYIYFVLYFCFFVFERGMELTRVAYVVQKPRFLDSILSIWIENWRSPCFTASNLDKRNNHIIQHNVSYKEKA